MQATKWIADSEALKPRHYAIEYQPPVGYYLFVYEGKGCTHDYLQDTLEFAKRQAE